ncbi:MAG: hypothetical protein WBD22_05650 [Pyrinomonadaceae bacterium]
MKKFIYIAIFAGVAFISPLFGQKASNVTSISGNTDAARIISTVTANERKLREAFSGYVFNRSATIHTIGMGGQITGTYRRDSFMSIGEDGRRFEKILFFPMATTPPGFVTPEDLEDLGGVNPFALEPAFVDQYNISLIGKERIDDLDLYVFDVTPKVIPDPKRSKLRLFTGRIWVDDKDLMIVKSKGKAVPETKVNKFPIVETWRENVEGKYWFPSYAAADDELIFDNGSSLRLKMKVTFTDYSPGKTDVKVIDEQIEETSPTPKPAQSPTPVKPE